MAVRLTSPRIYANVHPSSRPFNYGNNKPTHEEILEAQAPFSFDEIDALGAVDKATLNDLLVGLDSEPPAGDIVSRVILEDKEGDMIEEPAEEIGILLNRAERLRQKGPRRRQENTLLERGLTEISHQDTIDAEALAILDSRSAESPYPYSFAAWPTVETDGTNWDDNDKIGFGELMHPEETYCEDSLSTLDDRS